MALSLTRRLPAAARGSPGGPAAQLARHRQRRQGLCPDDALHARRGGFAGESLTEHAQIIKALEEGDVARAARAIEHHRMRAMARLAETT